MEAEKYVMILKHDGIIKEYAKLIHCSYSKAMNIYYNSILYYEVSNKISDLHCLSDEYLAEKLKRLEEK